MSTQQHHDNDGKYLHTARLMGCLDHLAAGCGKYCQTHGQSTNTVPEGVPVEAGLSPGPIMLLAVERLSAAWASAGLGPLLASGPCR